MAGSVELLAIGRGRLGAIDVVRVSAGGSARERQSLFEKRLVTRTWRGRIVPAAAFTRTRLMRAPTWSR